MACTTVEGSLSCLYSYWYWMQWSNTFLSCWDTSALLFQQHKITRIFCCFASVLVPSECFAYFPKEAGFPFQPTTILCVTNCYTVQVKDFFHSNNPFLFSNYPFCLFCPPLPSQVNWRVFLFRHLLSFITQTGLERPNSFAFSRSFFKFLFRSLTSHYCLIRSLHVSPSCTPTSSSWLASLHCNINSKLYSLSTRPSVSPISIPPLHLCLIHFLTPGRTTVRLKGGGVIRWLLTSQNYLTWYPPAVH